MYDCCDGPLSRRDHASIFLVAALVVTSVAPGSAHGQGTAPERRAVDDDTSGAATSAVEAEAPPARSLRSRGSLRYEIGGAMLGHLGGGAAGMALALVPAKLIPPEENTFPIIALSGGAASLVGAGLGAGLSGRRSGGNGSIGYAVLGSFAGTLASLVPLYGAMFVASRTGSKEALPIIAGIGVPVSYAGTIAGSVLGYRWSAGAERAVKPRAVRVQPIVAPPTEKSSGRLGFSVRW